MSPVERPAITASHTSRSRAVSPQARSSPSSCPPLTGSNVTAVRSSSPSSRLARSSSQPAASVTDPGAERSGGPGADDRSTHHHRGPAAGDVLEPVFLAAGAVIGVVLWWSGDDVAGRALVLYTCSFMAAAGVAMFVSDRLAMRRPREAGIVGAIAQTVPPAVAILGMVW